MIICNHHAEAHFMYGLMSDLVIANLEKYGHTGHQISSLRLDVIKQHKLTQ